MERTDIPAQNYNSSNSHCFNTWEKGAINIIVAY